MKLRLLWLIFGLAGSLVIPAVGQDSDSGGEAAPTGISPQVRWRIRDFAQDDSGQIWGIANWENLAEPFNHINEARRLVVFDETTVSWQEHDWEGRPEAAVPKALVRLATGAVGCYWRAGESSVVSLHRNGRSHFLGWLKGAVEEPRLLALTDGGLVISGKGPEAFRMGGPAPAQAAVLRLRDEWLLPAAGNDSGERNYAVLHAMEMDDGSLRLWNYGAEAQSGQWRLSGLVTWAKGGQAGLTKFPLVAEAPIMALAGGNDGSLLAAAAGKGLMRIHPPTGLWVEAIPPDSSWKYIEQMFSAAGGGYFITTPPPTTYEVTGSAVLQSHLSLERTKHYDTGRNGQSVET